MRGVICLLLAVLTTAIAAWGCRGRESPRAEGPMRIVVSITPLVGLVREIAPPDAEVGVLVPAGVSEHGYELTPGDVDRLRRADLIVGVGLGLEPRLEEIVRRLGDRADVLWFSDCLTPEELAIGGHASHEEEDHSGHDHDGHGHGGHDHAAGDPHLWLDPVLVEKFVRTLQTRVARVAGQVEEGDQTAQAPTPDALAARIRAVDARARDAMAPLRGRAIVTHHASHGRFAARYGLRVAATIRIAETSEPTPGQVEEAIRAIRGESVPAVFVEPQFDSSTAARIAAEAGVRVVTLDPMGEGDWFALMEHTITTIAGALSDTHAPPDSEGAP